MDLLERRGRQIMVWDSPGLPPRNAQVCAFCRLFRSPSRGVDDGVCAEKPSCSPVGKFVGAGVMRGRPGACSATAPTAARTATASRNAANIASLNTRAGYRSVNTDSRRKRRRKAPSTSGHALAVSVIIAKNVGAFVVCLRGIVQPALSECLQAAA